MPPSSVRFPIPVAAPPGGHRFVVPDGEDLVRRRSVAAEPQRALPLPERQCALQLSP